MDIEKARELVVDAGKKLVESGLIARTWGNISCRVDDSSFVITPSGRDYMSLTPGEIVKVNIKDCGWSGSIKPSSEKGVHAEVYRLRPEIGFVIHTHQKNASAVSASGVRFMYTDGRGSLGTKVPCAAYALPGTKRLRRNVAAAVACSEGRAVIMQNHGALCYGVDCREAFEAASELEEACENHLRHKYMELSGSGSFDADLMRSFAISRFAGIPGLKCESTVGTYCETQRSGNGFRTYIDGVETDAGSSELYRAIYEKHRNINCIIHAASPDITAVSCANTTIRPLLDDFAQLVGTSVKTVEEDGEKAAAALKSSTAVFIRSKGALCCGSNRSDAAAAALVVEKNCKAIIAAALSGGVKPLNPLECMLMRFVYLRKYSKYVDKNI